MKAVFEACYTGNGRFEASHMLLCFYRICILGEAEGGLLFILTSTIKIDQESFIYEDGWISLKPLSSGHFSKSFYHKKHCLTDKTFMKKSGTGENTEQK